MEEPEEKTPLLLEHKLKPYYGPWEKQSKSESGNQKLKKKSGLYGLFRYAKKSDIVLMAFGMFFAIVTGAGFPIMAFVFGQMTDTFISQSSQGFANSTQSSTLYSLEDSTTPLLPASSTPNNATSYSTYITSSTQNWLSSSSTLNSSFQPEAVQELISSVTSTTQDGFSYSTPELPPAWIGPPMTAEEFTSFMTQFALYYLYIGIGVFVAGVLQTLCWEVSCERQVFNLRQEFYYQVLRQDSGWFDKNQTGDLTTKLADDLERVREGIGVKFSMVVQSVATFISGFIVGGLVNWKLTLVILAITPILAVISGVIGKFAASSTAREQEKYGFAGHVGDEVLSSIKTVVAFGGQQKEIWRYELALKEGLKIARRKYLVMGIAMALLFLVMYSSYGLAFWYGSELILQGFSDPGSVFTVFFSALMGAFALGNAAPHLTTVAAAIGAMTNVLHIVDRVPDIDPYSKTGMTPDEVTGHIQFDNITFVYPSRPEVEVLKNFNLEIQPGKRIALVGSSGTGKSTIISMLMRYYDPFAGEVKLDGNNLKDLNLAWLRHQIGIVSQEPVLFDNTICENIRLGRDDIKFDDIVNASKMANAFDFITSLPQSFDTVVGDKGAQLSGGQKQRIAIARALIRNPKILLLDEATSALDANSESIVQEALDKAMKDRTTIIVAHRLSTIQNADVIYALKDGAIAECGTHEQLMLKEGYYYQLVMTQTSKDDDYLSSDNEAATSDFSSIGERHHKRQRSRTTQRMFSRSSTGYDQEKEEMLEELKEKQIEPASLWRILKFNSPERCMLSIGLIASAVGGCIMPIYALFYGQMFATFTLTGDELRSAAIFWSIMFVVLAVAAGLSNAIRLYTVAIAGEKMTLRLRMLAFANILRQSVGWFDDESHSPGRLTNRLSRDAPIVRSAAGHRVGMVLQCGVTIVTALGIAFFFGWKLALLLLAAVPIIIFAGYKQMSLIRGSLKKDSELMDEAGRIAAESIQNVKTVQALGREKLFYETYINHLFGPYREAKKQAIMFSITFAFSQAFVFIIYASAFRFGAYLIEIGDMTPTNVYRVFFALSFCAASVGQGFMFIQDYSKAKMAAALMFQLMDEKSQIDSSSPAGVKPDIQGKLSFCDVFFRYPTRLDVSVLKGLSFTVQPGQTLALVGSSGCGKSTVVSLIERFYDPHGGQILLDDFDIRTLNVAHMRSIIGLVTQEPILFDCTIRENIAYGAGRANPTYDDIIRAARIANAHEFISNLPQGYDTIVGERGTQLSGGQKQRVAIARALIRDPKILLLDEATSALDTQSEKVVQEALDRAREGRTCVIIAHRLSTIQNADCIAVINKGKIVEQGTHDILYEKRGLYYQLIKRQKVHH